MEHTAQIVVDGKVIWELKTDDFEDIHDFFYTYEVEQEIKEIFENDQDVTEE